MDNSEIITEKAKDNTEDDVKLELDNIYHILFDKYNSKNRYGILSDIKCLINKISLIQNDDEILE